MFINSVVPTGPTTGSFPPYRVWRGSAWVASADYLRVDAHRATDHSEENSSTGFDVCQDRIIFPTQRLASNINIGGILV